MKSLACVAMFTSWLCSSLALAQHSAAMDRVLGRTPPAVMARQDASLSAGTIAVEVVDEMDSPAAQTDVRVGVMYQDGKREEKHCTTNTEGYCEIPALATGTAQSYRVKVSHNGATFASTPFRLDPERGHRARVRRLGTTQDSEAVLMVMGRAMIEFENDKARITQEAQLANIRSEAYVFPQEGLFVALPEGFGAFDSRKVMTDQRVVPEEGGMRLYGSIAPGPVKLTWAYSLPFSGSKLELNLPVPFTAVEYQVISDAIGDLTLNVDGFPEARSHEGRSRQFLVTSLRPKRMAAPLDVIDIVITGIPTGVWLPRVALGLGLAMLLMGLLWIVRPADRSTFLARARARRRSELLDEAQVLEQERADGDVGERYYANRNREIVNELAELLKLEAADSDCLKPNPHVWSGSGVS